MRKSILFIISIAVMTILTGCSNVRFVETREGCRRGVGIFAWDICEDTDSPVPTPREKIRKD